jgi:hypothetical protein
LDVMTIESRQAPPRVAPISPASLVFLSAASFVVVFFSACQEPYITFHPRDCLVQVGVGSALIAAWLRLVLLIALRVVRRRVSPVWSIAGLWSILAIHSLWVCPTGYVSDIDRFALRAAPPGTPPIPRY